MLALSAGHTFGNVPCPNLIRCLCQKPGQVQNQSRFVDLREGKLELTILCKPVSDEFSQKPRTYLLASEVPYTFDVNVSKKWSFLGKILDAPIADCLDHVGAEI